jgi:undecaprenyl-diphosphatase
MTSLDPAHLAFTPFTVVLMEWLESLVMGVVQGLTEFLPISSDGHLNLTDKLFARFADLSRPEAENIFFFVMLHVGTLAAILIYYREYAIEGAKGLLGSAEVPDGYRRSQILWIGLLAGVATSPLVPLKLFLMDYIEQSFHGTLMTGVGFLITAAVMVLTFWLQRRSQNQAGKGPAETTLLDALLIGIAQMFAPLPGVSRSGLTVAAALGLGFSRTWAVGFSLLLAVPAILGAAVFEVRHVDPHTLNADRIAQTVAASVLAGVIGYGAIAWLVKIVRSGRMWYFSVYLIVLGTAVLTSVAIFGDVPDAGKANAPHRSVGRLHPRPDDPGGEARSSRPLDRAFPARTGSGAGGARQETGPLSLDPRVVLERPLERRR